jgi:hypothetical protein
MCKRCAELLNENARLRDLLELRTRADLIGRLKAYLGVTEAQARVLLRLYRDRGGLVPFLDLLRAIPVRYRRADSGDERSAQLLRVVLFQARTRLPKNTIETVRSYGYRLTPAGIDLVARALSGSLSYPEAA